MSDCATENVETIATMVKDYGYESVREVLFESIVKMNTFFTLQQPMTPANIKLTAELIIDSYPNIGIDAIKLFFRRACKGDFGQTYNTLDGQKICIWFDKFYREYWDELLDRKEQEHSNKKNELIVPNEEMQRIMNGLSGKGRKTDAELKEQSLIDSIRKQVIKENQHLYNTMPTNEADEVIKQKIQDRFLEEGIFANVSIN